MPHAHTKEHLFECPHLRQYAYYYTSKTVTAQEAAPMSHAHAKEHLEKSHLRAMKRRGRLGRGKERRQLAPQVCNTMHRRACCVSIRTCVPVKQVNRAPAIRWIDEFSAAYSSAEKAASVFALLYQ
jgi:hypothetical protein